MTNDLISLNLLSVNYKGICVCELSLLYTTIYNSTQLSLVNLPFWITVSGPFFPSGQYHFKGPKSKMIILWLWFPAVHSSFFQGLWLLYWVFSKRWLFYFFLLLWEFCSYLCRSGFQFHTWRDEMIHGRLRSRPGNRSLVFHSQLCPLLVAWL